MGPYVHPRYAYTDHSKELRKAMEHFCIVHGTVTPGRPETNGHADRNIRGILEVGTFWCPCLVCGHTHVGIVLSQGMYPTVQKLAMKVIRFPFPMV